MELGYEGIKKDGVQGTGCHRREGCMGRESLEIRGKFHLYIQPSTGGPGGRKYVRKILKA